jgi:four helix bundle protein
MYSLTDQIRRSARSVGAQIAEAWGKRRYEKHFLSKLSDADAEQMETQHWVSKALDCGYVTAPEAGRLNSTLEEIGRMLNAMMAKADCFCGPSPGVLHENATEYFTMTDD